MKIYNSSMFLRAVVGTAENDDSSYEFVLVNGHMPGYSFEVTEEFEYVSQSGVSMLNLLGLWKKTTT